MSGNKSTDWKTNFIINNMFNRPGIRGDNMFGRVHLCLDISGCPKMPSWGVKFAIWVLTQEIDLWDATR